MDLLSIPPEVIDAYVLPFLGWNDLLRLRRVCKWSKDIVDDYLKVNPELAPEIEINEEDKSLAAFLEMGIPTSKIFLNNRSGYDFYVENREDLVSFLEEFGPLIRSLRVDQISAVPFGEELDVLEGLKNLESLEAGQFGGYRRERGPRDMERILTKLYHQQRGDLRVFREDQRTLKYPLDFLKDLKTLRIGNNDDRYDIELFEYIQGYLVSGKALTSITPPFSLFAEPRPQFRHYDLRDRPLEMGFALLVDHLLLRRRDQGEEPICQEIDFANFHNLGEASVQFYHERPSVVKRFVMLSMFKNIKLMNVGASWFMGIEGFQRGLLGNPEILGMNVYSMVNIHPYTFRMEMRNLERVEVRSTARSSPGNNWRNERPEWPALKSLAIKVDSKTGQFPVTVTEASEVIVQTTTTTELFGFFFENVSRAAMTELHLEFVGGNVAIPKAESVVSACPNLKKLSLVKWPGLNKALIKLWGGLPGLEVISLEYCEPLGNVAFVGEDVRAPIFLKLSKLRKLTLKGLDKMPKITDLLFTLVIRHMKLTHLTLSSDAPIKSITAAGIRSLLDGGFAGSIEKFPFKDWSLEGVSGEEFKKLQEEFRSSNML